jgi:hypothetical protein
LISHSRSRRPHSRTSTTGNRPLGTGRSHNPIEYALSSNHDLLQRYHPTFVEEIRILGQFIETCRTRICTKVIKWRIFYRQLFCTDLCLRDDLNVSITEQVRLQTTIRRRFSNISELGRAVTIGSSLSPLAGVKKRRGVHSFPHHHLWYIICLISYSNVLWIYWDCYYAQKPCCRLKIAMDSLVRSIRMFCHVYIIF